jgi:hypothetical protein
MDNESTDINKEKTKKKHYNEEKCELFFDYNDSSLENILKENNNKTYQINSDYYSQYHNIYDNNSNNNNYYSFLNKSYNEGQSTKINSSLNSYNLKDYIQNKKITFNIISNSMKKIIDKHKSEEINYNLEYINDNKNFNYYNNKNKNKNLSQIVDHLIKAYSKDELKIIKEKINKKVEEEEEDEPKPEKFLYNYINHKKSKNKQYLKLSSDSPSFLKSINKKNSKIKEKNKNQYFKSINKNINYKPIKLNIKNISNNKKIKNNKNIFNKTHFFNIDNNNSKNNIKFKPEFYTYIKCKTSFEYLDNILKRQKSYNDFISKNKNKTNLNNKKNVFIPNSSSTSTSKYSIKIESGPIDSYKKDKSQKLIYNSLPKRNENKKNLKLKYVKSLTFTPNKNKYNKKEKTKNNKNEKNKEVTPIKYINHKFDYVKSIYKNDNELFKRIKEQNEKKNKKYEKLKTEYENEKLEGCTFKPDMSKTYHKNLSYIKLKNENKIKNNKKEESNKDNKDNKNFTYVDFYQYKKKKENKSRNKNKDNKDNKDKDIDKEKIGSLTPIIIPKKLKNETTVNKRNNNNNSFLVMHKLLLDNKPNN